MRKENLFDWTSIMVDKHWRSVTKAISWRTVGTIDTIVISWLITGELTFAISIGAVELFTKMFLYYGHERIWNRIKFGRVEAKSVDYSI